VTQRRSPAFGHHKNSAYSGRGTIKTQAMPRMTVIWMSNALRSQIVTIDQVSALRNPTRGDK